MIAIIDYGVGNLRSIEKSLKKLNIDSIITNDIEEINASNAIILPGVGAFKDAIDNLKSKNLIDVINENLKMGKKLLGICLGMQLLYEKSFEDGEFEGLGLIEGDVVKMEGTPKVPHIGWNQLEIKREDPLLKYIEEGDYVYFVHSYHVSSNNEEMLASADYNITIPAIVKKDNVYGIQFHPEKSGDVGLKILKAFGELI